MIKVEIDRLSMIKWTLIDRLSGKRIQKSRIPIFGKEV